MDFSLPENILKLKAEARDWVENVLNPMSGPLEEEERIPEELVEELRNGQFRFFGLTIPQGIRWRRVERHRMVYGLGRTVQGLCHGKAHRPYHERSFLAATTLLWK